MADTIAEQELESTSWEYIKLRAGELKKNRLTARLILDFNKGDLVQVQDQAIVTGASIFAHYLDKVIS